MEKKYKEHTRGEWVWVRLKEQPSHWTMEDYCRWGIEFGKIYETARSDSWSEYVALRGTDGIVIHIDDFEEVTYLENLEKILKEE